MVERIVAGVPLGAHRHQGGDREGRHHERGRPGPHREGEDGERRAGDRGDEPGAAHLGLDEEPAELGAEHRSCVKRGVEYVDEGKKPRDAGGHGEHGGGDRGGVQGDVELPLPGPQGEQGRHKHADHARGGKVHDHLRDRESPPHERAGVAELEPGRAAAERQPGEQGNEPGHAEERGSCGAECARSEPQHGWALRGGAAGGGRGHVS